MEDEPAERGRMLRNWLMSVTTEKKGKLFYGWWIVIACAIQNIFAGGTFFYGFTAFFNPIREQFGWTSAQTALAFSLQRLEGGIAAPLVGYLFDRLGPRKLILFGMIVAGGGLIYMSRIQSLGAFYGAFIVIAVGTSFGLAAVSMATIANWFIRKRGRALSFLMAGFGLSGTVVPLLVLLIAQFDWRTSLVIVGIGFWVIGIPVAMVTRHKPEQYGYLPDGDTVVTSDNEASAVIESSSTGPASSEINFGIREAMRTRAFWLIALTYMMAQFATSSVMILEMPHLENVGISRQLAGLVMTFMTLLSLVGRLGSGFLGDKIDKRYVIAGALALQCIGMIVFANIQQPWHLIPFLILYGPGYGGTIPIRPALTADYFGRTNFGTIQGLMMGIAVLGGVVSPVVAGQFFDITGTYREIFLIYAALIVVAIPAILAAKRPFLKSQP